MWARFYTVVTLVFTVATLSLLKCWYTVLLNVIFVCSNSGHDANILL
jgi:hypothetical protein